MVASVDGLAEAAGISAGLSSPADRQLLQVLAGRRTSSSWAPVCLPRRRLDVGQPGPGSLPQLAGLPYHGPDRSARRHHRRRILRRRHVPLLALEASPARQRAADRLGRPEPRIRRGGDRGAAAGRVGASVGETSRRKTVPPAAAASRSRSVGNDRNPASHNGKTPGARTGCGFAGSPWLSPRCRRAWRSSFGRRGRTPRCARSTAWARRPRLFRRLRSASRGCFRLCRGLRSRATQPAGVRRAGRGPRPA
jgi:hypothetical protein